MSNIAIAIVWLKGWSNNIVLISSFKEMMLAGNII